MDEFSAYVTAGKLLASVGFTDDEIEAVKRFARETPAKGHTSGQTMMLLAQTMKQNPEAKGRLIELTATPKEVREAEAELLARAIPIIRDRRQHYPNPEATAEVAGLLRDAIATMFPNVEAEKREAAFLAGWTENDWAFDARPVARALVGIGPS